MATPQAERKKDLAYQKQVEETLQEILARLASLEKKIKELKDAK